MNLATRRCIRNLPRVCLCRTQRVQTPGCLAETAQLSGDQRELQYHASIHQILKKSPAALQLSIQRYDRPQHTFLAMCVGRQTRLPDGLVNRMVSQYL